MKRGWIKHEGNVSAIHLVNLILRLMFPLFSGTKKLLSGHERQCIGMTKRAVIVIFLLAFMVASQVLAESEPPTVPKDHRQFIAKMDGDRLVMTMDEQVLFADYYLRQHFRPWTQHISAYQNAEVRQFFSRYEKDYRGSGLRCERGSVSRPMPGYRCFRHWRSGRLPCDGSTSEGCHS